MVSKRMVLAGAISFNQNFIDCLVAYAWENVFSIEETRKARHVGHFTTMRDNALDLNGLFSTSFSNCSNRIVLRGKVVLQLPKM